MSPEHQDAPDESRREEGFATRWRMTVGILLGLTVGLIMGVYDGESLPSIVMTVLLLAVSVFFAVRSDLKRNSRP